MKICVLCNADWEGYDPSPYLDGYTFEVYWIEKATATEQLLALAPLGFDVFLNLCDGAVDEDRAGIEVVQTLERLGLPFTGAASDFYDPTRERMKRACASVGINSPRSVFVSDNLGLDLAGALDYPLIVKHPQSYSSVGLTKDSRVELRAQLGVRANQMIQEYGSALVEEFVEGREFSVLVVQSLVNGADAHAYEPVEFVFPKGESFKHYDLKWNDWRGMECIPCDDPVLAGRLKDMSRRLFTALNGSGYGRCDIRMDSLGELYMLEINPNCGVFFSLEEPGSADSILMNDSRGHRGFLERTIEIALTQHQRAIANGGTARGVSVRN